MFRVRAENRYGRSDPCMTEEVPIKDPFGLPGPPEKPKITEYSKTSMTLTWEPPRETGGSMITGYWLEKREKGTAYWARVNKAPITKRGMKGWEYQVSPRFNPMSSDFPLNLRYDELCCLHRGILGSSDLKSCCGGGVTVVKKQLQYNHTALLKKIYFELGSKSLELNQVGFSGSLVFVPCHDLPLQRYYILMLSHTF